MVRVRQPVPEITRKALFWILQSLEIFDVGVAPQMIKPLFRYE